ncbi:hypothetical protein KC19_12G109700 [Ceratodon purpureus]|uniref:Uncharacterized protein n=1 Tax=Ceratodon purpureus TaxID=3225 RepID=A0A8T0G887_CERPU|nr:hypothetical protein KC19_12G109700 [Ceratodon purpureus]
MCLIFQAIRSLSLLCAVQSSTIFPQQINTGNNLETSTQVPRCGVKINRSFQNSL